jgi:hypothetical protein
MAIDYTMKWVKAKTLWDNIAKNIAEFIYENIIIEFGCPTHLISDQGNHFINKNIIILVEEFMITQHKLTMYYPQGNGQAKLTNNTLGKILTKLVNIN